MGGRERAWHKNWATVRSFWTHNDRNFIQNQMYTESKELLAGPTTLHTAPSLCHGWMSYGTCHLMPATIKDQIEEELYVMTCGVFTAYTKPRALIEIYGLMTYLYHHSLAWKGQICILLDCTISEWTFDSEECLPTRASQTNPSAVVWMSVSPRLSCLNAWSPTGGNVGGGGGL